MHSEYWILSTGDTGRAVAAGTIGIVPAPTVTERLVLTPLDLRDERMLRAVTRIEQDARTWRHLPDAMPRDDEATRASFERHARSWSEHGLGWWAIVLRAAVGDAASGAVVGLGGAAATVPGQPMWNVGFRLAPEVWGAGLATELGRAAVDIAHTVRPDYPVTARALARNTASTRVLERLGLPLHWEGPVPDDVPVTAGLVLRVYADRPLEPAMLAAQVALG